LRGVRPAESRCVANIAAVVTLSDLEYEADGRTMVGLLAQPTVSGSVPAVLIAHGAPGLDDHCRTRAAALAELGYAALAIDYHGGGRVYTDPQELAERLEVIGSDPDRLRALGRAGLDALLAQERVDATRVVAVGYCFGAVVMMELARTGAHVRAVVGFHPGLASGRPQDSRNIVGQVLMCVGADDPLVPIEDRVVFEDEMRASGVNWQMNVYGGAKHRFTDPHAAKTGAPGLEYHQSATDRSWRAMIDLFHEVLT
jgi:dienelactone hydrolase